MKTQAQRAASWYATAAADLWDARTWPANASKYHARCREAAHIANLLAHQASANGQQYLG